MEDLNICLENTQRLKLLLESVNTPEDLLLDILELLESTDFYIAPASTKYHGACPGGLFNHSMAVAELLIEWGKKGLICWGHDWSPAVIGLLHDFTKVGKYTLIKIDYTVRPLECDYEYNTDALTYGGHGSDSCIKLLQKIRLTEEETLCIRYHMGAYEKEDWNGFEKAIAQYETVLWTHHADMVASKVLGV